MSAAFPSTPRRGNQRTSHLRHMSNGSSVNSAGPSEAGTIQHDPEPLRPPVEKKCVLWIHDDPFSLPDVVINLDLFPDVQVGELMAIVPLKVDSQENVSTSKMDGDALHPSIRRDQSVSNSNGRGGNNNNRNPNFGNHYLFIAKDMPKEMKAKQPHMEVSVARNIADSFHLKSRSQVLVRTTDPAISSASHVELSFKDEYLSRSDMWRLALQELANKTVFKNQKILFLGTIKAQVTAIYIAGRKVQSAFYSANTKPIFRSESARYVIFIQMSREMWDFDSEGSGEIMFNKVVNGFLPALFKKWALLKAKHLVSIVMFTRVEYDTGIASELATATHDTNYHTGTQPEGKKQPYKDFYRVVVSDMASGSWTTILYQLKREFRFFLRDISTHRINLINSLPPLPGAKEDTNKVLGTRIEARPSLAMYGNVLEAINLASSQFAHDYIDRDLVRTGISIVVVTPSPGLFEVDYETLRMTTETLIGNGIGIDLVCLPKMPLHSVPLFRYRNPLYITFQESLQQKSFRSEDSTPRQNPPIFGSSFSSMNESLSPLKASLHGVRTSSFSTSSPPSQWSFAIPHWIDVSFWTGASQDVHSGIPATKTTKSHRKKERTQKSQDFAIRCKMYEMEMASVMENVLSEITVTPLQHNTLFPQMVFGSREIPGSRASLRETPVTREKIFASCMEFVNGPAKPLYDRSSSQEERSFFKALDKFDISISEVLEDVTPEIRTHGEGRRLFKPGSDEAIVKPLFQDPKIFGSSFDDKRNVKGVIPTDSPSTKMKTNLQNGEDAIKPYRENLSSTMSVKTSPARPAKFGRQISLGKFGFGIAAPKAAVAEIQIEHVNAPRPATSVHRALDLKKPSTGKMANHLLGTTGQERPGSSNSNKSRIQPETPPSERSSSESVESPRALGGRTTRPMTIKSALQSLDSTNQFKSRSLLGSVYEVHDKHVESDNTVTLQNIRLDDAQKVFNSKLVAGSVLELPATLSPARAMSPWLSVLNPSNPNTDDIIGPSQYRRWQHVFPRPLNTRTMKWKSLCSPASVPLTTEYFPTRYQLDTEYQQKPYNIYPNTEDDLNEVGKSRNEFLRELVSLRLSQGFQIVVSSAVSKAFGQKSLKIANLFDPGDIAEDGASVFMSMGNIIHQLSCVKETEIEVNMFVRKPAASTTSNSAIAVPFSYKPAIRTTLADNYYSRDMVLGNPRDECKWNQVDAFIAGFDDEMSENLRFWRARFVLIPVERPGQLNRQGEDNEEEIRLEGIKKLTQTWQRHRIVTASERRYQSLADRKTKDQNPLDIVYKTEDPSIVVTAELETLPLLETGDVGIRRGQLLEHEWFRKSKLDIGALAEAIQAPVERGGVRMQNRRWHFRLHYNCFIGSDMTTWLIENFEDISTREEAVELGNMLMAKDELQRIRERETSKDGEKNKDRDMGIFVHVEKRHPFRDGQYFYQVTGEFAKQRPESRSGWFGSRRRDISIPSTPMSETMSRESPRPERSISSSHHDEKSSDSGTTTPTTAGGKKPKVALSKVMKYDVDPRGRSYRPERINLHYDRLHNPDNCYHIRIDWMAVTAKLIEDAIESWARTAEAYGLRLVEAPIGEACNITSMHPFRSPYVIELIVQPPDQQPRTYFDVHSFAPHIHGSPASRHYYQKAIMKKFNFVLDVEAARNFPSNVDVTYSWGRPDFKYTQYIHRSGVILAQITDKGDFLLLANRLFNNRVSSASRELDRYVKTEHVRNHRIPSGLYGHWIKPTSPPNSPLVRAQASTNHQNSPNLRPTSDVLASSHPGSKTNHSSTPESIKDELETFCRSAPMLEAFYREVLERSTPPSATPPTLRSPYAGGLLDSNIPILGLPPGVLGARDSSPSPMRLTSLSMGARRQSVQTGFSGESVRQDSPRESIESDKGA
ncbi:hypothetical protein HYFRA_00004712 [Hymenoscyphus fraxineus]|uniref:Vacuolar membrane-associated protein IML1 n=1 Tax=Hymenoscyphus fraxineus TaxID=746836 RepID=A0A9N9PUR6_9HELO|nr:hypothetical protein HYFRA_00004712 [Hymenoscyphus fraxineus]